MAAKIEVNVGVEDSAFDAFSRKFRDYQEKLETTPGAWEKVSRSSEESSVHFDMITAALSQQADDMGRIADKVSGVRRNSEATARSWRDLASSTHSVAKNIGEATVSLMKWSGVIGLVTGAAGLLTGYAGFEGMASIGSGVSSARAASLGLGTSYGGRASFLTNFERMGDAGGFLSRVNEVQHSADNVSLRALGLTQEQAQGDTADVGANAILGLKKLVDGVKDPRFLQDTLKANRADDLVSLQQAQALRGMSPQEVQELVANYRRDKDKLGLSKDAQRKWQDFSTQMSRAGREIETTFIKRLGVLTPGLTRLSEAAVNLTDRLTEKDGPLSRWIDSLAHGVEWLADEVGKPDFQRKVDHFIESMVGLASGTASLLAGVLKWAAALGITPAEAATVPVGGVGGAGGMGVGLGGSGGGGHPSGSGGSGGVGGAVGSGGGWAGGADGAFKLARNWGDVSYSQVEAAIVESFAKRGMDPNIGLGILHGESIGGYVGDGGTSFGIGHFHFGGWANEMVRAGINVRDPSTYKQQAEYMAEHLKKDPGSLRDFHGFRTGYNFLKRSGRGYHPTNPPANTQTKITITKPTGADPHMAAAAAAAP